MCPATIFSAARACSSDIPGARRPRTVRKCEPRFFSALTSKPMGTNSSAPSSCAGNHLRAGSTHTTAYRPQLRLGEGERPEEHAVEHREDRGAGADADGQREDGRGREAGTLAQGAKGEADILHGSLRPGAAAAQEPADGEFEISPEGLHGFT